MEKKEFYAKCAELFDSENLYVDSPPIIQKMNRHTGEMYQPMTRATRWSHREPGNGRFSNHGLIRVFSNNIIHVSLNDPSLNGTFDSFEKVLEMIQQAMDK